MCRFSRPIRSVSGTTIFARDSGRGRQILVYGMKLAADQELAMILGLPVQPGGDDALRFLDLSGYPNFFLDLDHGFPSDGLGGSRGRPQGRAQKAPLAVVEVGSFEASYVPSIADFDRLDPRFRLSPSVWDEQPGHEGFGFAVFKLKPGERRIHPMAFEFTRADEARLFFPTVHVHDGQAHPTARFDHALYYQRAEGERAGVLSAWEESREPARAFIRWAMPDPRTPMRWLGEGIVDGDLRVYRRRIQGEARNEDVYV
jgi:hypothetical protein